MRLSCIILGIAPTLAPKACGITRVRIVGDQTEFRTGYYSVHFYSPGVTPPCEVGR